jgi:hypothetical protein
MLLCRVEEKHTRPIIVTRPSRIMGGEFLMFFLVRKGNGRAWILLKLWPSQKLKGLGN